MHSGWVDPLGARLRGAAGRVPSALGRWLALLAAICGGAAMLLVGAPPTTDPGELLVRLDALPSPTPGPRLLVPLPTRAPLLAAELPELADEDDDGEEQPAAGPPLLPRPRRAMREPGDAPAAGRQRAQPRSTREPRATATPGRPRPTAEPRSARSRPTQAPRPGRVGSPRAEANRSARPSAGAPAAGEPRADLPLEAEEAPLADVDSTPEPRRSLRRGATIRLTSHAPDSADDDAGTESADDSPADPRPVRTRTPRTPRPTATPRPPRARATPAAGLVPAAPTPTRTATTVDTRRPTRTPRATATPRSTAAPLATATRRPTNTPRPTATPRPTRTATAERIPTATASPIARPLGAGSRFVAVVAGASGRSLNGSLTGKALLFGLVASLPGATFNALRVGDGDLQDAELNKYDTLVLLSLPTRG